MGNEMFVRVREILRTWAFRCRSETHQEKVFEMYYVRAVSLLQEVGVLSKDHAILGHLAADDTSYSRKDGKEGWTTRSDVQPWSGFLGGPSLKEST